MAGLTGYAQSSGYAEQALSSVKVVAAFGMEAVEIKNYSKYLKSASDIGKKAGLAFAIAITCFMGGLDLSYAYGFWLGGIYIEKGYWNHILGRAYMGGDILCIFWGVVLGFFAFSAIGPQIKALIEGKVAGK